LKVTGLQASNAKAIEKILTQALSATPESEELMRFVMHIRRGYAREANNDFLGAKDDLQ